MNTTRPSLLLRIKDRSDAEAWKDFQELYAPLLYRYARARGLSREDAEDVRDECIAVVARKIAAFEYDKAKGGFKNWLYRIASGKVIDLLRQHREKHADSGQMAALADSEPTPDEAWETNWRNQHLMYCVEQVRSCVSEKNHEAFRLLSYEECSVEDVCARLDMTPEQVYQAKSRVLKQVRQLLRELEPDLAE
jgi:RNA polymerase sigma-70 factor (ECF subfamily)